MLQIHQKYMRLHIPDVHPHLNERHIVVEPQGRRREGGMVVEQNVQLHGPHLAGLEIVPPENGLPDVCIPTGIRTG